MKKIMSILFPILVLSVLLITFHRVFSFKFDDGISQMKSFYELENNSLDILILGSSHAFVNIDPAILWRDAGIASYNLAGSVAPLWNSYFELKEALKTQHPKLVILEGYCLTQNYEYIDDSRIIKNIYGMKPSINKFDALKVSAPKERWAEFGLEHIQYHRRYTELSSEDYRPYKGNEPYYSSYLGQWIFWVQNQFEAPQVVNDGSTTEISEKQEGYYRKIIELCADEHIPLMVTITPYVGYNNYDMQIFNTAKEIADSYCIPFVNFNESCQEIGFDYNCDFIDSAHMSYKGTAKYTSYLAQYLEKHYDWISHSNEPEKYARWDSALEYYNRSVANHELTTIQDLNSYSAALGKLSDDYTIILNMKSPIAEDPSTTGLINQLEVWSIPIEQLQEGVVWVINDEGTQQVSERDIGFYWGCRFGGKELLVDGDGIYWDKKNYQKSESGLNVVIFDEINQTIADTVGIQGVSIIR